MLYRLEPCCRSTSSCPCLAWWSKERMYVQTTCFSSGHNIQLSLGFVYRFISTGTIEEKIFQRQASKQALSSAVVDEKEDAERHFSVDALRKLFLLNENTLSGEVNHIFCNVSIKISEKMLVSNKSWGIISTCAKLKAWMGPVKFLDIEVIAYVIMLISGHT